MLYDKLSIRAFISSVLPYDNSPEMFPHYCKKILLTAASNFVIVEQSLHMLCFIQIKYISRGHTMTHHEFRTTRLLTPILFLIAIVMIVGLTGCQEQLNTDNDKNLISAKITRVVDGDTMKVTLMDKQSSEETIRLLLIDTPETVHPNIEVQPFGPEASAYAKKTLEGRDVQLEIDVSERDKYGRLLVYLWIGDQMFNEMLLEEGLARVAYVIPPNIKYIDQFRVIQQNSQKSGKGIWSIENYALEEGFQEEVKPSSTNIEIVHVTSPIEANHEATLTAKVPPGAAASIRVKYKSGASTAAGLEDKQADSEGIVSWSWRISPNTKAGTWSIVISCNGESKTTDFIVS
jgi:micrococcal nuclease